MPDAIEDTRSFSNPCFDNSTDEVFTIINADTLILVFIIKNVVLTYAFYFFATP